MHSTANRAKTPACPTLNVGSYQQERYILETDFEIPNEPIEHSSLNASDETQLLAYVPDTNNSFTIKTNQVYALNVFISSASGKTRQSPKFDAGILQHNVSTRVNMKLKSARAAVSTAHKKYSTFPFSARGLVESNPETRLGLAECLNNGVFVSLPVIEEVNRDAIVAQFKCTILMTPKGAERITVSPVDLGLPYCHSAFTVPEEIAGMIRTPMRGDKSARIENDAMEE